MITTTSTPNDATSNANNNTLIKSDLEGGVKNLNKSKNKNPIKDKSKLRFYTSL